MKNKRAIVALSILAVTVGGVMFGVQNCGMRVSPKGAFNNQSQPAGSVADADGYTQIERLGRPAVNEGLLVANDKLQAFNSIPPTLDLATDNPAVLAVLQDASAALDLFDRLEGVENFADGFNSQVVAGFLPDVMRIDTTKSIPPGTAAYNGDFVVVAGTNAAILTGGRKIEDDVVDITLSYLVAGDPTGQTIKDNVTFPGVTGNIAQGHARLNGQGVYGGPATFPFLAVPR
jgi:hypothetical protein